jgi:hypothetical protein
VLFGEALMALREVHSDLRREVKLPRRSIQFGYSSATVSYVPTVTVPSLRKQLLSSAKS